MVVFILLIAGPLIASPYLKSLRNISTMNLQQPSGLNHNDTFNSITGSVLENFGQVATGTNGGGGGGGGGGAAQTGGGGAAPTGFNFKRRSF